MTRRLLVSKLILVLLFFTISLPAWAQENREKITIAGARSITPLAEQFSTKFRKDHPGIDIEILGGGSNYAVNATRQGDIDIGLVARNLSSKEREELYVEPFGHDAIFLLTYPGNPVDSLTLEQLRKIYLGQISNWSTFGGEEKGIVPLTREKNSNIRNIFIRHVFGKNFTSQLKAFTIRARKEKILKTIKRIEGSIGYGILNFEQAQSQRVKVLAVNGRLPTPENIRDALYPLVRQRHLICRSKTQGVVREWIRGFRKFAGHDTVSRKRQ